MSPNNSSRQPRTGKRHRKNRATNLAFSVRYLRRSRELYNRFLESKPWISALYSDFLEIHRRRRIVDVGCGLGDFTRFLARISKGNAEVLGIDRSKKSIQIATADTKKERSSQVSYKVGDVYKLPLEDGYADLTCCRTLLMHLKDPPSAVKEMARITGSQGSIVAVERGRMMAYYDPNDEPYSALAQQEYESFVDGTRRLDGTEFWIGEKLPGIFQKAGLTDIRAEVHADAWLNTDPRRSLRDLKAQLRFDYSFFQNNRRKERRYLLAGGMSNRKIGLFYNRLESRTKAFLADDEKLRGDPSFYGDSFILVSGTKRS